MWTSQRFALICLSALFTMSGCAGGAAGPNLLSGASAEPANAVSTESVCSAPAPGDAACTAILRNDVGVSTLTFMSQSKELQTLSVRPPGGLSPAQLHTAYQVPNGGSGQTVAIVNAYDDPKAEADLNVYRNQYGLGACTTANACFKKVAQDGSTNYPAANASWAGEISLDLDMVSAICPNCKILLVEANTASLANLGMAVNKAVALHANVVSNSYGAPEVSGETTLDDFYNHPGVAMTAAAGDTGYGVNYPAASKYVIAVGGTQLAMSNVGLRGYTETAWSGGASGCSAYESKPSWQHDKGCTRRTDNDIAFDASPQSPVAVYQSYCGGSVCGWVLYGGTSVGAPAIAGMIAVSGKASKMNAAQSLYGLTLGSLTDITSGSNGKCSTTYFCNAGLGYDGPSGLGSLLGTAAL
jgi:subtilase family serine protease